MYPAGQFFQYPTIKWNAHRLIKPLRRTEVVRSGRFRHTGISAAFVSGGQQCVN